LINVQLMASDYVVGVFQMDIVSPMLHLFIIHVLWLYIPQDYGTLWQLFTIAIMNVFFIVKDFYFNS